MSEQHSAEPWDVHQDAAGIIVQRANPDESLLGLDIDEYACFMNEHDARRIVACVNACAGIDTEYLEGTDALPQFSRKMMQQRDHLLSALEEVAKERGCENCIKWVGAFHLPCFVCMHNCKTSNDSHWHPDFIASIAINAITKAKGGES